MKKRLLSMLLVLMMALTLLPTAALAAPEDVPIDAMHFVDESFRIYVTANFDTNSDGSLSNAEIAEVVSINVAGKEIDSLKGVEYFTALKFLTCEGNSSESPSLDLDVSKNTKLEELFCIGVQLTSLDVSKNTALTTLYCKNNQLTSLDVSKNTELTTLDCSINQLGDLNVSKNTELTTLDCSTNQLTSLDVSKNTKLTKLYCGGNKLSSLDVSKNTELTVLNCNSNRLTSLDVSKNTELMQIECLTNQLTSLDVSKNTELETLACSGNQLSDLNVSENTKLTVLKCNSNRLTSLDVSKNTGLKVLNCRNNSYSITLSTGRTFDLSTLPGFVVNKASDFKGGTVADNILTFGETADKVTYVYDCGNDNTATFKLILRYITLTENSDDLTLTVVNAAASEDEDQILVARYNGDGKLLDVKIHTLDTLSESGYNRTKTIAKPDTDEKIKVFLLSSGTYAPICEAAQWPAV